MPKKRHRIANYGFRWLILAVDFLIFVAAVIYSVFSYRQWQAMNDQLGEMKKMTANARLDQRPWVNVHSAKLSKPLEVGDAPVANFNVTNSGKTPALNGRMFGIILSAEPNMGFDTSLDPAKLGADFTHFVIAPGRTNEVTAPYGPANPISKQSDIDDIRNGKKCLFFIGHIFYEDVFGETHSTEFCAKMCSDLFDSRTFILCNEGNTLN
jgi:hypothetical protein